jgi:hypothetical protein
LSGLPRACWLILLLFSLILAFTWLDRPPRLVREVFWWSMALALMAAFWQGRRAVLQHGRSWLPGLAWGGLGLAFIALCVLPFHSTDLWGYVNRGWQQVSYASNPYTTPIAALAGWQWDPALTNHWVNNPCPYGFLFAQLAHGLVRLVYGLLGWVGLPAEAGQLAIGFKLANGFFWAGTALLLWRLASSPPFAQQHSDRSQQTVILYDFLWQPLLLLHLLSNGHNDGWMAFFLLLSVALAGAKRGWVAALSLPALLAATLVKYATGWLLPLLCVFVARRVGRGWAGAGVGLSLVLGCLLAWPYVQAPWPWSQLLDNATLSHNSLHALVRHLADWLAQAVPSLQPGTTQLGPLLKAVLWGAFGLWWLSTFFSACRKPALFPQDLVLWTVAGMLGLLLLVSSKFYPWYLAMVYPVALLLPLAHPLRRVLLAVASGQLLAFTFMGQAHVVNYLVMSVVPALWVLWRGHKCKTRVGLGR